MITLLMLSGGLDSTYALARILRETEDEVLVHHVHMLNNSGRHEREAEACANIVKYCTEQYRPFSFTQSVIDHRRFIAHGYDLVAAGFEAGMVAASFYMTHNRNVFKWIVGHAADDAAPRKRYKHAQDCCVFNCQDGSPPMLHVFTPVDAAAEAAYLGPDLLDLTWSCRAPVKGDDDGVTPCGVCPACVRRAAISPAALATPESVVVELKPWMDLARPVNTSE